MLELIVHCVACAVIGGVGSRIINVARRGLRRHRPRLMLLCAHPARVTSPAMKIRRTSAQWYELIGARERARNNRHRPRVSSRHE
jgi:hypothetical protein